MCEFLTCNARAREEGGMIPWGGGACAHYKKRGDFKKLPNTLLCKTDYKFEKSVNVQVRKNMMEYVNPSRRGRIESLSELSMKDMLPYEV